MFLNKRTIDNHFLLTWIAGFYIKKKLLLSFCPDWVENSTIWFSLSNYKPNKTLFHSLHRISQVCRFVVAFFIHSLLECCKLEANYLYIIYSSQTWLNMLSSFFTLPSRCLNAKGDVSADCEKFARYYRSLCPAEWVRCWLFLFWSSWLIV